MRLDTVSFRFVLLILVGFYIDSATCDGGVSITQDMYTRCPLKSTALVTCTNRNQISLEFLSGNSCVDCLIASVGSSGGDCAGANEEVCAAVDECSANCTAIAGECAGPFEELLQCQLEKGIPVNNCTIQCESTSAATGAKPSLWVQLWRGTLLGIILLASSCVVL
jgi:hypothetical protein